MSLTRGERVTMIRELGHRLSAMSWTESNLLLEEFGFLLHLEHSRSQFEDVTTKLRAGTDDDLVDLYRHVFPEPPTPEGARSPGDDRRWSSGYLRLFISHVSADKEYVSDLKAALAPWHVDAFVAHEDIEPSREWIEEIELALAGCHALLAYLTPTFHKSLFTYQEVGVAIARRILIVPVRCGLDPYGLFARFQAVQGLGAETWLLARQVVRTLAGSPLTAALMAERLVASLEISSSYERTRDLMELIEAVSTWTPDQLARLERAGEENRQVREAVTRLAPTQKSRQVPVVIQSIVERHSG